jgi:hypothetical protein
MKTNLNKTVSANAKGIIVSYTDTLKHFSITYEDKGLLNVQLSGNKFKENSYQAITQNNLKQQKLYREALYGLSIYTQEEIAKMTFVEKKRVITLQQRAKKLLNVWKQELAHAKLQTVKHVFSKFSFVTSLIEYPEYLNEVDRNTLSFKDLSITKEDITEKLISAGILPSNFYQLT